MVFIRIISIKIGSSSMKPKILSIYKLFLLIKVLRLFKLFKLMNTLVGSFFLLLRFSLELFTNLEVLTNYILLI